MMLESPDYLSHGGFVRMGALNHLCVLFQYLRGRDNEA